MLPSLLTLLVLASCDDPASKGRDDPPQDDPDSPEDVGSVRLAWERQELTSLGSVTISELLYDAPDASGEWLELYNPMALDMDLSGWSLTEGVAFTFPEGTVLAARGYLVVAADPDTLGIEGALGPFVGRLDDAGERVTLTNNAGRRIDSVRYGNDDPWSVSAAGSGLTLAKRDPEAASDRAENWEASAQLGGTPGAANGIDPEAPPVTVTLVAEDALWRYEDGGDALPSAWTTLAFDDTAWDEARATFYAGDTVADEVDARIKVTADNYYAVYLGDAEGSDLRLVGEDPDGDWTTVETHASTLGPTDHLYLAAWEAPWDDGGPQMTIAEVELPDDAVGTDIAAFEWALGPEGACPGVAPADAPPDAATIAAHVAEANVNGDWEEPAVEAARTSDPWGWAVSGAFSDAARFVWADTFDGLSVTNTSNTWALFRSVEPLLRDAGATRLPAIPTTTAFRTHFRLDADPSDTRLSLDCTLDDGAVIYLNGVEVHRENLPAGALSQDTLATRSVDAATLRVVVASDALVRGDNVLAVELHQAQRVDPDLRFGCSLTGSMTHVQEPPPVVLNELAGTSEGPFSVELAGRAIDGAELGGMVLATRSGEQVLEGGRLRDGELRVLSDVDFPVNAGEVLFLWSVDRNTLLDAIRVGSAPRARNASGAWRTPDSLTLGEPNRVTTVEDIVVNEVMYHRAPVSEEGLPVAERPEAWIELTNRGAAPVDLGGWQLVDAVAYTFPSGTTLAPGGYLVVANDPAGLSAEHPGIAVTGPFEGNLDNGSDRVLLLDARGNPADEVRYHDGGRWPEAADGKGASLELRDPRADNATAEAWAASDERARTSWVDVAYRTDAAPSVVGPDGTWEELVLGLLDAGEVLLDDVHVTEDPDGARRELVPNGTFDDTRRWRLLGNHRHAEIVADPDDAANRVLRLRATGPTGHMHNHAETTLAAPIGGATYEIRYRARWVSGNNQLHTRLYFNRGARTVRLPRPERAGTPGAPNTALVDNLGPTFEALAQDVAVPAPNTPVTVAVDVHDPDGVGSVTLWASVDGASWTAQPMTASDARWSGVLAGERAGAIVQFYVEATDARGATSTYPAAGRDSRALLTFDGGEAADNGLHNLRILLTPADSAWLHDPVNLMSDDNVGATVIYEENRVYHDVGVRTKGSQRGRPEAARLGYGLRFQPDQPFRGSHTSVLVDRSEGVGYGQREVLMNLVMTHAGSPYGEYNDLIQAITPLGQHRGPAELQLDRLSDLVLDAQFEDGASGSLYEYELIYFPYTTDDGTPEGRKLPQPDAVIGTPLTDLGDESEAWRWTFMLQSNEVVDDYAPIQRLGRAFAAPEFPAGADAVIDVDAWLRAFAFATVAGAVDNYGGDGSQHNARFYARPDDGKFLYVPHDADFYGSPDAPVVGNGDLARLLTDPSNLRAYYGHLDDILARAYDATYLAPWCDQLATLTRQDFVSHCAFVATRADWLRYGAPDAVMTLFPAVSFAVTTPEPVEASSGEVTLRGTAWIDVKELVHDGIPLAVRWIDATTWEVRVPVGAGATEVTLVAVDLHGEEVGRGRVEVE